MTTIVKDNNKLTIGNYKIEYVSGEWHLSGGNYIEPVRSDSRDTLIKIACRITSFEQEGELIRQMFSLALKESKEKEVEK